jgi:hypothetical protein
VPRDAPSGAQFRRDPRSELALLVPRALRSVRLINEHGASVKLHGIKLKQYTMAASALQNATANPANAAFFSLGPSGLVNVTRCARAMPVFISAPHFYGAAPELRRGVAGLRPERALHDTFINVEPHTGTAFLQNRRLQTNVWLEPLRAMAWFPRLRPVYAPVAWFDEHTEITEAQANEFKSSIYVLLTAKSVVTYAGYVGGPLLLLFPFLYFVCVVLSDWRRRGTWHYDLAPMDGSSIDVAPPPAAAAAAPAAEAKQSIVTNHVLYTPSTSYHPDHLAASHRQRLTQTPSYVLATPSRAGFVSPPQFTSPLL